MLTVPLLVSARKVDDEATPSSLIIWVLSLVIVLSTLIITCLIIYICRNRGNFSGGRLQSR